MNASGHAGSTWATISAHADGSGGKVRIEGSTPDAEWSLTVEKGLPGRPAVPATYIPDLGTLPSEHWTVHMIWPTTKVSGSMTNRATGKVNSVHGHGYRENSFGRWLFALDGWDFAIFSDVERDLLGRGGRGVAWQWQTYHKSREGTGNTVDVSFYDGAELRSLHFSGQKEEMGWYHEDWSFSKAARQCVPRNAVVEAANDEYYIIAEIRIGESQVPLLSTATPVTGVYVINEWVPTINGNITRQSDGSLVAAFEGIAGGEFSSLRNELSDRDASWCKQWGKRFSHPFKRDRSHLIV